MSQVFGPPLKGRIRLHDIFAMKEFHAVRIFLLLECDVDAWETYERMCTALEQGETRVYMPRLLRWRAFSNLQLWIS